MPVFGDYSTIGEPVAVVDERGHVSTVWQARLTESSDGRLYVVKAYSPRKRSAHPTEGEGALDRDRRLEFIEGIKELKKAQGNAPNSLAPVHAFGIAPEGAWYVTDFYPRSLKTWINLKVRTDSAALRHVVYSLVAGCLALKRSRGFSHGNLKTSNIFLVGKPRPLRRTPLHISDPYPASSYQLAQLDATDRQAVGDLMTQTMEAQDLRTLGELILQLVEGRLISGSYEYDYPVAKTAAWDQLGREGERWRSWCNQLLDPQLSLDHINLEMLEKEFRPSAVAGKAAMVAGGVVVVCLVVGGIYGFHRWNERRQAKEYETLLSDAQTRYNATLNASVDSVCVSNLLSARDAANQASKYSLTATRAADLETQIDRRISEAYLLCITSAGQQTKANAFSDASNSIQLALALKPSGDPAINDARANLLASESDDLVAQGNKAEKGGNWGDAKEIFNRAAELAHAVGDAQREKFADDERDYAGAINAGITEEGARNVAGVQTAIAKARAIRPNASEWKTLQDWADSRNSIDALNGLISEVDNAIAKTNWAAADQSLGAAIHSASKLGDSREQSLKDELQYVREMKAGEEALSASNFPEAERYGNNAKSFEKGQAAAIDLLGRIERAKRDARANADLIARRNNMEKTLQEAGIAERSGNWSGAVEKLTLAKGYADDLDDPTNAYIRVEINFATLMKSGLLLWTNGDYEKANSAAVNALALRSENEAAKRLKEMAGTSLDKASKYAAAMESATNNWNQVAKLGDSDEAIAKLNLAIADCGTAENLRVSTDPSTLKTILQGEIDRVNKRMSNERVAAADLEKITNAFNSGEYLTALNLCAGHSDDLRFTKLQGDISTEETAYNTAKADFDAGEFASVENVGKQSYAHKPPFAALYQSATNMLGNLTQLQVWQANTNWQAVESKFSESDMEPLKNKKPFKTVYEWAVEERKAQEDQRIKYRDQLDTLLETYLIDFNFGVPAWLKTKIPRPKDADRQPSPLGSERKAYFQDRVSDLRKWYTSLGILKENNREALLNDLADRISTY